MNRKAISLGVVVAVASLLSLHCGQAQDGKTDSTKAGGADSMSLQLTSTAFAHEQMIPEVYTCDGKDMSPPLEWSSAPDSTKSFALICDDPDAPGQTWVHWVVFNIPADYRELTDSVQAGRVIEAGINQGSNSWGKNSYGGPCPPSGTHRYFFKLYALDTTFDLEGNVDKDHLLKQMDGHILAQAELMGKYSRQK